LVKEGDMVKEKLHGLSPRVIQLDTGGAEYLEILAGPPETVSMRSGLVVLSPGNSVGVHSTGGFEEVVLVLEGEGEMRLTGQNPLTIGAGVAVYCPPETEHDILNTGTGPLRYIYVVAKI
jgi:quercetin dioxygenase-like cupin family protein